MGNLFELTDGGAFWSLHTKTTGDNEGTNDDYELL